MFVDIVIKGSLKPGYGFSLEVPDQSSDGLSRHLAAPRVKFAIVGRAKVNTERRRVPSRGKVALKTKGKWQVL